MKQTEWADKVYEEAGLMSNLADQREFGIHSWWMAMRDSYERLRELFDPMKFPEKD